MIVVIPNVMGIALWSPPLDKMGNSVRGVSFCKRLIETFNFHNYDSLLHTNSIKSDPRRREWKQKDRSQTVLYVARAGDLTAMRRLFLQGVDISTSDYDGRTALHVAAAEGDLVMMKFLVNVAKVPVSNKDRYLPVVLCLMADSRWGRTPVDDAIFFKRQNCEKFLRKAMKRPDRSTSVSSTSSNDDDSSEFWDELDRRKVSFFNDPIPSPPRSSEDHPNGVDSPQGQ